jgi:hypothetical protein
MEQNISWGPIDSQLANKTQLFIKAEGILSLSQEPLLLPIRSQINPLSNLHSYLSAVHFNIGLCKLLTTRNKLNIDLPMSCVQQYCYFFNSFISQSSQYLDHVALLLVWWMWVRSTGVTLLTAKTVILSKSAVVSLRPPKIPHGQQRYYNELKVWSLYKW